MKHTLPQIEAADARPETPFDRYLRLARVYLSALPDDDVPVDAISEELNDLWDSLTLAEQSRANAALRDESVKGPIP